ncbi:MAG: hypothetical protein ACI4R8_03720 [Candidatus Caccovivens sp.]
MKIEKIKDELKEIKFYYGNKELFDDASKEIGECSIASKIEKYNNAIRKAPVRLYEIYVSLYVHNNSFDSLASKLAYTYDYIQKLNRRLLKFFEENIEEKEDC